MRWCRVQTEDGCSFGRVVDDRIVTVDGDPFSQYRERGEVLDIAHAAWRHPVLPSVFYAVGFNYSDHIEEVARDSGTAPKYPRRPEVGYRANNALIGHREAIVKPAEFSGRFELEAEVVAVIGRMLRRCSREEARAGIFGWTIGNDVSAREWQHTDRTFYRAKNADTFKPMGPWIDTEVDPAESMTRVSVNGTEIAAFRTGDMIFDAVDYIVEIARYSTLQPGDILWMGADGASEISPGDEIDIGITGIGTLHNPVTLGGKG